MSDDQVRAILADARRRAFAEPKTTWPPEFVGIQQDPSLGLTWDELDARMGPRWK
jgi:hypothetical protein